MFNNLYLSAVLALGLAGCPSSSSRLDDIVLHADMNGDGKKDIVRLRRSEGLECKMGFEDERKSPPGIYVLLGLGNSHYDGHPVYNLCEIKVWDLSGLYSTDPRLGKIEVTDYNKDGKPDIVYTPVVKSMDTIVFLGRGGDGLVWDSVIVP